MTNIINFIVLKKDEGLRVDQFLTKKEKSLSRMRIKNLILKKHLKINHSININPSKKIYEGDAVSLEILKPEKQSLKPYNYKLDIIFEDDHLIVLNKSAGISVHPGAGDYDKTIVNALINYSKGKSKLSNIGDEIRPGIVHRIDKETSGLLVVAKNNFAHANLGKQFSDHTIKRKYQCLIWGVIRPLNGKIQTLISRNKKNRQLMTVSEFSGKKAVTNYVTKKIYNIKDVPKISFIECELETGRTHQIRVHLKYKGTSIIGDNKYGKKNIKFKKLNKEFENKLGKIKGQALHAQTLEFVHPTKNRWVRFKSNMPKDFKNLFDLLNNLSG